MVSVEYVRSMAAYNRWQNENLYRSAGTLSDKERKLERGAFFGSIHGTLNHILWGDQRWLSRFGAVEPPASICSMTETAELYTDWQSIVEARKNFDETITGWAKALDPSWLSSEINWTSFAVGKTFDQPAWLLTVQMFNHQTHHRGQVHAMLTAADIQPDDTDIAFMPNN
ncbi:MAG: damage-inducible protein DinB [Rhodospirillaceae bacterium]|nr:damage-inducible protein DinB [Rhodospirillaceae bacterium]